MLLSDLTYERAGKVLRALYRGRTDQYGEFRLREQEHHSVPGPLTTEHYIAHLKGEQVIGPYYSMDGDVCHVFSIDIDTNDLSAAVMAHNFAKDRWGWTPAVSTSKGKGYHVDTFIEGNTPVSCAKVRVIMQGMKRALFPNVGFNIDEFPASDGLTKKGLGNYCQLPLSGHFMQSVGRTFFLNPDDNWAPIDSVEAGLARAYKQSRLLPEKLDEVVLDLNRSGLLQHDERARCPDLFPDDYNRHVAERAAREEAKRKRAAEGIYIPPRDLDETNLLLLYQSCGKELEEEAYDHIRDRIFTHDIPCIKRLFSGAVEGHRDVACFYLTTHLMVTFHLSEKAAMDVMQEWNSRNRPSMSSSAVEYKVRHVYSQSKYRSFGCEKAGMQIFCHGVCPIMSKERQASELQTLVRNFRHSVSPISPTRVFSGASELNMTQVQIDQVQSVAASTGPLLKFKAPTEVPRVQAQENLPVVAPVKVVPQIETADMFPEGPTLLEDTQTKPLPLVGDTASSIETELPKSAKDPYTDPMLTGLPIGFRLDTVKKTLHYEDAVFLISASRAVFSGTTVRASMACHIKEGKHTTLTNMISVTLSNDRDRLKLFKNLRDTAIYNEQYLEGVLLQFYNLLQNDASVNATVVTKGKQKEGGFSGPPSRISPGNPFGGPGGGGDGGDGGSGGAKTGTVALGLSPTNLVIGVSSEALQGSLVEVEHIVESAVSFTKGLYWMDVQLPVRQQVEKKVGQEVHVSEVETYAPFVVVSDGTSGKKPANPEIQAGISELFRMHSPHSDVFIPQRRLRGAVDSPLRWSPESVTQFMANKKKDPAWRPDYTLLDIITEIRDIYRTFLYFVNEADYSVNACWDVLTYLFPICPAFPFIFLNGERNSGKTTVCDIKQMVCFNAMMCVNPTDAALFRTVDNLRPTFIMDEREDLETSISADKRNELTATVTLLNASYKNNESGVPRIDMTDGIGKLVDFKCYSPKVLANISGVPDTILDRSIKITMVSPPQSHRYDQLTPQVKHSEWWGLLRDKIYTWVMAGGFMDFHNVYYGGAYKPKMQMKTRSQEIWAPLYALAELVALENDASFMEDIYQASHGDKNQKKASVTESFPYQVLQSLQAIILSKDNARIAWTKAGEFKIYLYDLLTEVSSYHPDQDRTMKHSKFQTQVLGVLKKLNIGFTSSPVGVERAYKDDAGEVKMRKTMTKALVMSKAQVDQALYMYSIPVSGASGIEQIKR